MARLLVLIVLLGLLLWGVHWFRTAPASQVARMLRRVLIWGGIGLLLVAVASGRLSPLFAALAAAVPLVLRLLNVLTMLPLIQQALQALGFKTTLGQAGGQAGDQTGGPRGQSRIRTRYLDMTLDQRTGRMDGSVRDGPFSGERLSALDSTQLARLLEFYQDSDAQSAAVLRAYLEKTNPDAQAEDGTGETRPVSGQLSRGEASAILGLSTGASPDAVRDAHRRLMQKLHPDRGGSDYLAARINEAKKVLLEE
ncbi:DnaJ domain protein [Thiorhodovibrio winogradskyi]|uniref:DnaJ domain protein n=1 Tax=Thiorhodovibrio winogradskyi TaxID=77007 RepID=A0ABZ0S9D8_9GAMM|nr:molecular chaperone DnaJ [Thiorhodovibrio winogradskyi]